VGKDKEECNRVRMQSTWEGKSSEERRRWKWKRKRGDKCVLINLFIKPSSHGSKQLESPLDKNGKELKGKEDERESVTNGMERDKSSKSWARKE
jgi:hypothetical protein